MPSFDEIRKLCNRYAFDNLYVDPGIPVNKLANARTSYGIPDDERVAALFISGWGTGTDGLAVAEKGLYWHNAFETSFSMSWEELAEVSIVEKGQDIHFSDRKYFAITGYAQKVKYILAVLTELQKLVQEGGAGSDQWMVAVAGQQNGPYDVETLRQMIQSRQIDPEAALVWCEKMGQWALLREVPEFRAAAPAKRPPPLVAPPAGPTSAPPLPSPAPAEEKTEFTLVLKEHGPRKIDVIKVIRQLTNLGLKEAKDVAEAEGSTILENVNKNAANEAKKKLEDVGAVVVLNMVSFDAERESSMPSFDEIRKLCNRYASSNYYVDPRIPAKKLANARKSYGIPDDERVAALLICGWCTGTDGLAVAERGLYWHNMNASSTAMSWKELAEVSMVETRRDIQFSVRKAFHITPNNPKDILPLLKDLQKLAAEGGAGSDKWMVAVAGQQYGPYDIQTLRQMIQSRQVDPEAAQVWCEKMDQWAVLREVPEFRAAAPAKRPPPLVAPPAGPTFAPPLPSASTPGAPPPQSGGAPGALVDLNTASFDQILTLPGMWVGAAAQVIEIRKQRGGFQSVDEVGHALDWPPHKVQRLAERAEVVELPRASLGAGRVVDF